MQKKRRIALIIETSSSYGRELLKGILKFIRAHDEEWSVFFEERELSSAPPPWLHQWDGDGIISRATTRRLAEAVAATGVPLVELTDRRLDLGFPHVWSDDAAIGRMAAEHLQERGFRNYGFAGFNEEAWSARRENSFAQAVRLSGGKFFSFNSPWYIQATESWEEHQQRLTDWVAGVPKPIGIMASNDVRGHHLLQACASVALAVPEQVSVIGVDNDQLLCQFCQPKLSSVIPNAELVGYRATDLLSQLMRGEKLEQREYLIEPLGVATRQSSDVVAIDDPGVAAALSFIREHACRGITVEDVLAKVPVSRSFLERKLRKLLKRSPQQEIRHFQLKRAKELLTETDLPIEKIASLCGFEHPEYMHVVFKREEKTTPGQYRRAGKLS